MYPTIRSICQSSFLFLAMANAQTALAFTFLANPPAKLTATKESPDINFTWDGNSPVLSEKDSYKGGIYSGMTDQEVMRTLITEAMASWNNVRGSYLHLTMTETTDELISDGEDLTNVIVISETSNLNSAAYASPSFSNKTDRSQDIIDCDITVDTAKVSVEFMLYALTHELGHCIGLGHAHDNYSSIMGYSRTPGNASLSPDDKAGAIYLYGDPAYGDQKVKEVIRQNCGVLGGKSQSSNGMLSLMLLALPLLMPLTKAFRKS